MLQFIVLGQVPGTHIQITYRWLLLASVLFGVAIFVLFRMWQHVISRPETIKETKTAKAT
jgi:hypothetical protein